MFVTNHVRPNRAVYILCKILATRCSVGNGTFDLFLTPKSCSRGFDPKDGLDTVVLNALIDISIEAVALGLVQSFFDMQAPRQPHVFLPFFLLILWVYRFFRVFLYNCRFLLVWKARRSFPPSGWCFSAL